jgi:hypothetical protein
VAKTNSSMTRQVAWSCPANLSNTVDLTNGPTRAILTATDGTVKVTYKNGLEDDPFLAAGMWHPMEVVRIWSTGTSATGVKAGY